MYMVSPTLFNVDDHSGMYGVAPLVMTSFTETVFDVARVNSIGSAVEANQGENYTANIHPATRNPLQTWIIQAGSWHSIRLWYNVAVIIACTGVIMITTQVLSLPLKKIRQPRVIAEVLGGIMLGPSGLGRIPGFTQAIFPSASKPYLALVANIGLVLFMFLIGLEIEGGAIRRSARLSASIALSGMVIPFALGAAFSVALYKEFIDSDTEFTHFLLLVCVAFSITAFPVLCRILTELKLLDTTVGVVVLSAGVANDVVGWTLLAFSMALAKAASGLTALWVLLACVGWALLLLFPVRAMFLALARRTGSIENGPTMLFMTTTMLMMLCSALVTDTIGIHAIFGSFLAGLIIPREGGLANAFIEKLEDMVSIIFLPLYFTMSGLSTDFSLLDNGITWVYTIGIISIAWAGKFGGCMIAARISGFRWREAMSIGTLMSCKGLVELIVLNVGLSAGILNTRVYSMFVLEALLLTFFTTPVVVALYPPEHRKRAAITGPEYHGVIDNEDTPKHAIEQYMLISRLTVILDKLEHLPGILNMIQLFRPFVLELSQHDPANTIHSGSSLEQGETSSPTLTPSSSTIQALRLIELSECTSTTMKSSIADSLIRIDPLLNLFKTFCAMSNIPVSPSLMAVPFDDLATIVIDHARETLSHIVLVPWSPFHLLTTHSSDHASGDHLVPSAQRGDARSIRPMDMPLSSGILTEPSSGLHLQFVRSIFTRSSVNVALFVALDRWHSEFGHFSHQRVVFPFFGGPDDRLALMMVVHMCRNPETTAKVIRIAGHSGAAEEDYVPEFSHTPANDGRETTMVADVKHGGHAADMMASGCINTGRTRLQSKAADNILWKNFTTFSSLQPLATRAAIEQVEFIELEQPTSLREVLSRVRRETDIAVQEKLRPVVITGRRRCPAETRCAELKGLFDSERRWDVAPEVRETIGDVAAALAASSNTAGVLVVQSMGT